MPNPSAQSSSSSLLNQIGVGVFMRVMIPATVAWSVYNDPVAGGFLCSGMSVLSLASHPFPRASHFLSPRINPRRLAHPVLPIATAGILACIASVANEPQSAPHAHSEPIVSAAAE